MTKYLTVCLTVEDVTPLMVKYPHIQIADRGIVNLDEESYEDPLKNAVCEESILYDGELEWLPARWNKRVVDYIAPLRDGFRLELKPLHSLEQMQNNWINEADLYTKSWRTALTPEQAALAARWDDLENYWEEEGYRPFYSQWKDTLTASEAEMIAVWDNNGYTKK